MTAVKENPATQQPPRKRRAKVHLSSQQINEAGLGVALIAVVIGLAVSTPHFASVSNTWGILGDAATVGIVAWASTLVIVAGEIDISVGPAVAFWGVTLSKLALHVNLYLAILLTLIGGAAAGGFAGWLRARFGVPSFIATLGLWSSMRGLAQYISNQLPIPITETSFLSRLGGKVGPVYTATIIMIVLFIVFEFIARRTTYGRSVFAIGGNARAAMLSGINVSRIRVTLFATTGLMAALLGIVLAARLQSGNAGTADGLEFDTIAAVVVGGTSLSGGRGSMIGTLLGVLFITVIGNGLVLRNIDSNLQGVIRGVLIVGAVLINNVVLARRGAKQN